MSQLDKLREFLVGLLKAKEEKDKAALREGFEEADAMDVAAEEEEKKELFGRAMQENLQAAMDLMNQLGGDMARVNKKYRKSPSRERES